MLEGSHLVSRDELGAIIWPDSAPATWERSLSALISRLRGLLRLVGGGASVTAGPEGYYLELPSEAWIDIQAAASDLDVAEGLARDGAFARAWGPTNVAVSILARPFLRGVDCPWADSQRRHLGDLHLRALDLLSRVSLAE